MRFDPGEESVDSNHRYGTDKIGLDGFATANNWAGEGIVSCAAP